MKILVAVKRVVDFNVKVRVKADGTGVETANVKMSMNPFDEIAVEEAVRLKEAGTATEIVVVSCGAQACQETLRTALAIGADRAILVETDCGAAAARGREAAEGGRCRRKARSSSSSASRRSTTTPTRPARCSRRCSDWPQATFASKVKIADDKAEVTREVDGGLETISIKLPAVVTTDLRLNEPRYVTLPNIMKAKKKTLEMLKPDALGVDVAPRLQTLKVVEPAQAQGGRQGRRRRRRWSTSCATKRR